MGFADEAMGAAGFVEGGPEMANLRREQARATLEAQQQEFPGTFMTGEIAGAVASPANRLLGPTATVGQAARQGAVLGAVNAAGRAEGDDRLAAGASGAALGALFGAGAKKTVDFGTARFRNLFQKTAERPTLEGLRAVKSEAYRAVDNAGEVFKKQEMAGLARVANDLAKQGDYVAGVDKQTGAALDLLNRYAKRDVTIGQLDKLRQALWARYNAAPNEVLIRDMIDEIDNLIQNRPATSDLMAAARVANQRYKKAELLERAFQRAEDQTASTGSGGNILNKYRQAVTSIINDQKRAKWFTSAEIDQMRGFVQGSVSENQLRRIGKIAPNGNGLMLALNLGAVAVDPTMLAVTAGAQGAKAAADRSAMAGQQALIDMVTGYSPAAAPQIAGRAMAVPGLLAGNLTE
jgi:hypothetical protein